MIKYLSVVVHGLAPIFFNDHYFLSRLLTSGQANLPFILHRPQYHFSTPPLKNTSHRSLPCCNYVNKITAHCNQGRNMPYLAIHPITNFTILAGSHDIQTTPLIWASFVSNLKTNTQSYSTCRIVSELCDKLYCVKGTIFLGRTPASSIELRFL